jgi:hypothetical protein
MILLPVMVLEQPPARVLAATNSGEYAQNTSKPRIQPD